MMLHFDFSKLQEKDFKEDSVREFIIMPLLRLLGFDEKNLILSKKLTTKTRIGSNKEIELTTFPDYTLLLNSKPHCILDAKAPSENISLQSNNERQVFYYAINKEIKAPFYALCNGRTFSLFQTSLQECVLTLDIEQECKECAIATNVLSPKLELLKQYLTTPLESLKQTLTKDSKTPKKPDSWYLSRELPKVITNPQKQAKARYFGCTAYFTRQSWDIVTQNIKNFTDEGDVVLDSFGGSGVTAIEAMMQGRIGIHTDLNPLSVFMAKALSAKVNLSELYELSEKILSEFESLRPKNEKEAKTLLKGAKYYPNALDSEFGEVATQKEQDSILWIPQDELLPKGSDVDSVLQLFSKKQLAELAILRKLIFKHTTPSGSKESRIHKRNMRYSLMLAFRNTITMCNLTYHDSEARKGKGGNSGVLAYYRYRIAKKPIFLNVAEIFQGKTKLIIRGKKELESSPIFYDSYFFPTKRVIKDFKNQELSKREQEDFNKVDSLLNKTNGEKIFQADATNLREIQSESIDFIYTDPPYGAKIPYLDLSTMWNVWLDLPVDSSLKEKECIEKGSLEKSRYDYYDLMKASLKEMYRVLKYNRWLAFVFQHQDPKLFQIIVESAENVGFEYAGSIRQDNGQASFKKVQNPTRVLKGQIIIYFKKVDNPKSRATTEMGFDVVERMFQDIEAIIVSNNGATLEEIWDNLVIKAMDNGYLDLIAGKFETFIPVINERYEKDLEDKYHLKENYAPTNYDIPLEKRVEYLIKTMLGRAKMEKRGVSFDDIVLQVIPLSKNGIQANKKMVKEILHDLAIEDSKTGQWKLKGKSGTQESLFD